MTGTSSGADAEVPRTTRVLNTFLHASEDVLYGLIAILLVIGAVVVLIHAGVTLYTDALHEPSHAIEGTLDSLLIVFILVELLSAVRETVRQRQLVAEPFLLVGIIASIKEIVVTGAFAEEHTNVQESMLTVGVLGAVVVGLSLAAFVLRRKEREPQEGDAP